MGIRRKQTLHQVIPAFGPANAIDGGRLADVITTV